MSFGDKFISRATRLVYTAVFGRIFVVLVAGLAFFMGK
jgi:hypothetical protein